MPGAVLIWLLQRRGLSGHPRACFSWSGYRKTPHTFRCEGMPPTTLPEPPFRGKVFIGISKASDCQRCQPQIQRRPPTRSAGSLFRVLTKTKTVR